MPVTRSLVEVDHGCTEVALASARVEDAKLPAHFSGREEAECGSDAPGGREERSGAPEEEGHPGQTAASEAKAHRSKSLGR